MNQSGKQNNNKEVVCFLFLFFLSFFNGDFAREQADAPSSGSVERPLPLYFKIKQERVERRLRKRKQRLRFEICRKVSDVPTLKDVLSNCFSSSALEEQCSVKSVYFK